MKRSKSLLMRLKLGAIWEQFNRGEKVPNVLVVGPGWKPPAQIRAAPCWYIDLT